MTTLEKIRAEIIEEYKNHQINGWEKLAVDIIDKYASEECEHDCEHCAYLECPKEPSEDAYDKVLAYLKDNVDDFPDYHEAIEAVLKMKGGE